MEGIGDKIRILCRVRRITQIELSKMSGVTQATISNVMNNKSSNLSTLAKITEALGVDIEALYSEFPYGLLQNVGDKIRFLCGYRKMTQDELSQRSGVSNVTISRIVNLSQNPKPRTLAKIAEALGVNIEALYPESSCKLPQNIGDKIRLLCRVRGITQKELSKMSGVTEGTISNVMNNKTSSPRTLAKIAEALGVNIETLYPESSCKLSQNIGDKIRMACRVSGITQKELSKMSGVTQATISNVMNNKSSNPNTLAKIAEALGVNIEELCT